MDAKQQKIKEIYKHLYSEDKIDENGWFDNTNEKITFLQSNFLGECDYKENCFFRPKSLQGIENNNGWIKIESENDLPKDNTRCHFIIDGYEELEKQGTYIDGLFWDNQSAYTKEIITHYQPIIKPEPPIY